MTDIKISSEIKSAAAILGEEKAVEAMAKAGFDAWDFSLHPMSGYDKKTKTFLPNDHPLAGKDYLAFARKLKQIGLDNGISCNQSHAPYPTSRPEIRSLLKKAIECTAEAGGKICVVHPENRKNAEENKALFAHILPFAKECGVKIATENMWLWDKEKDEAMFAACATPEDFCRHIDVMEDEDLVACLDIGHAEMRGNNTSAVELIHALGHRLQALHIHDNDKWRDRHQIPFSMKIDYKPILKALKEIGYHGYFTLEANSFLENYNRENVFDGIKKLARSAKKLVEMYEETDEKYRI